jgi:LacI family transcriptional regulator
LITEAGVAGKVYDSSVATAGHARDASTDLRRRREGEAVDMSSKPITIRDVAAMAKVSQGTVSKVLNDGPGVGDKTRSRILKLIQDLDYHPDAAARSLSVRKTGSIGVVIPHTGSYSMSSAYWPILLTSITEGVAARNQNVLLSTAQSEEDADSAYRSILRGRRVDGLIVGAEQFRPKQLAELLFKGFPFVMVGKNPVVQHWHVDVDNVGGAQAMTRHLVELGHRHIAMLAGPEGLPYVEGRVEGFRAAMTAAGLEPRVFHCPYDPESAARCVNELLGEPPRATALFAAAGDLTTFAIAAAQELGLAIPSELAVVAFDEHPFYEYFSPPITAVSQPIHRLGQCALEMLFTLMDGKEPPSRGCILPTRLVIRSSCGSGAPIRARRGP